jgi:DNA-binding response OmpR family regulator
METPIKENEGQQSSILIVEDNPINVRLFSTILEPCGYRVMTALNPQEAFDLLAREKPHLILLDVMLPGMDGFQVARTIKTHAEWKDIPIIFVTARNEVESIVEGFDAGGVDYVTKPYNPPELLARVRTHLELQHAREKIQTLQGLLPICASCKKIRDKTGTWQRLESYVSEHSKAKFTHGLCPDCARELYPEIIKQRAGHG